MWPGVVMAAVRIPTDSRSEQSSAVVSLQSPVRLYSVMRGKWTVSMISAFPSALEKGASRFCTYVMPYAPSVSQILMACIMLRENFSAGPPSAAVPAPVPAPLSARAAKPLTVDSLGVM